MDSDKGRAQVPGKRVKPILCIAGLVLLCLWAAFFGALSFLESKSGQALWLPVLNRSIPGRIELDSLDIGLLSGTLEINNLGLETAEGRTLIRVQRISTAVSWSRLFRGQVYVSGISIHRPKADISIARDGSLDLVSALVRPDAPDSQDKIRDKTPKGFGPPLNLMIESCRLTQGNLVFSQSPDTPPLKISGVDIDLSHVDLLKTKARLRLDADSLSLGPETLRHLLIQCELDDQEIRISRSKLSSGMGDLSLEGQLDLSSAFPDGLWADRMVLDRLGYAFTLFADNINLGGLPHLKDQAKGLVHGEIHISGQGVSPDRLTGDVKAEGQIKDFWCRGMTRPLDAGFSAAAHLSDARVILSPFQVKVSGLRLEGEGDLDLSSLAFKGGLSLGGDLKTLPLDIDLKGELSSRVQVDGTLDRPGVTAFIQADDLHVQGKRVGDARAEFSFADGTMDLSNIDIVQEDARLKGQGRVQILDTDNTLVPDPSLVWILKGEGIHLDAVAPNIRGTIDFDASGRGTLLTPIADLKAVGQSIGMDEVEIGRVELTALWEKGGLDLTRLGLLNKGSFLDLKGRIQLLDPKGTTPLTDPRLEGGVMDGKILLEDFLSTASGTLSLGGKVQGSLYQPQGQFQIRGSGLGVSGQPLERVNADLALDRGRVDIQAADIQLGPGARITAQGSLSLPEQTLDIRLETQNFDLTRITKIEQAPVDKGLAFADIRVHGPWKTPGAEGNLGIRELTILGESQAPVDLALHLENGILGVKGEMGVRVEGGLDLNSQEFSAACEMADLDLSPYFRLAGQSEFSGRVSGGIQAKGVLGQWDRTQAVIDLHGLSLSRENSPMLRADHLKAAIENNQLSLPLTRIGLGSAGFLNIQGRGEWENLDISAKGQIPLDMISPWLDPVVSAHGILGLSAGLTGSFADPKLWADLAFNDLGMGLAGTDQKIKKLGGRVGFDGQTLELEGIEGFLDEGRFSLAGTTVFDRGQVRDMDLRFQADRLALDIPDLMSLTLNSDLALGGQKGDFLLKGDVVLLEGLYYRDVNLDLLAMATQQTREIAPEEERENGLLDAVRLDVNIQGRQPLLVENNLADLEISPDLTLGGTAALPVLSGRARVDTGVIRYQKTEFEVTKGVIDFMNPYGIAPEVDIEARTEIRTWTITLKVSGTPEDLRLTFTSDPAEQPGDILSLIALGKTTRELQSSEGGGSLAPEQVFAGLVADRLEKDVKDAVGLDYFKINPREDADSPGVNVTVGADLSRQISVKYGVDIKDGETVQRVTTTYKLLENLLLNGYQDTGGTFGGELKYRLEFR